MYKILHWIFGWDYIAWGNSADDGISRVIKNPDGSVIYKRYFIMKIYDRITHKEQVVWLTCKPEKYFPEPETEYEKTDLSSASRQYRHNNGKGLLHAYDKEETEAIVKKLDMKIASLKKQVDDCHC